MKKKLSVRELKRLTEAAVAVQFAFLLVVAGCSTMPAPPVEQMAVSRAAVERVSSSPNVADAAPVELQQARQKFERAQRAMNDKDYALARRMAIEAEVDTRVAEARTSSARGERALLEVRESIRGLQDELNRRAPR